MAFAVRKITGTRRVASRAPTASRRTRAVSPGAAFLDDDRDGTADSMPARYVPERNRTFGARRTDGRCRR
jgi:hypothetical protein